MIRRIRINGIIGIEICFLFGHALKVVSVVTTGKCLYDFINEVDCLDRVRSS